MLMRFSLYYMLNKEIISPSDMKRLNLVSSIFIVDTDGRPTSHQSRTSPSFRDTKPSIRRRGLKSRPWPTGKQTFCIGSTLKPFWNLESLFFHFIVTTSTVVLSAYEKVRFHRIFLKVNNGLIQLLNFKSCLYFVCPVIGLSYD